MILQATTSLLWAASCQGNLFLLTTFMKSFQEGLAATIKIKPVTRDEKGLCVSFDGHEKQKRSS